MKSKWSVSNQEQILNLEGFNFKDSKLKNPFVKVWVWGRKKNPSLDQRPKKGVSAKVRDKKKAWSF